MKNDMYSTYILIDTTLLGEMREKPWLKKNRRPTWITPIYGRDAVAVSPLIIDVERAVQCSRISQMMALVNSQRPQLGVSFIETELSPQDLVWHLKKFIHVVTEDKTELTLRFADCAVLPALSAVATPDQWAVLVAPFKSWKIHGRDEVLKSLPLTQPSELAPTPLEFSDRQVAALREAMGTDQLLAHLRLARPAADSFYQSLQAYEYADQARNMWRAAGHEDGPDLVLFARSVFDTDGQLLGMIGLDQILIQDDLQMVRKDLSRLVAHQRG